ncbi:MAG TPA: succinyl-diaminopimelate desuccinylase [Microthrixaceae bacterium]|nr:succinyl-diaminopimelate desuccinylase [Microthrixaceae bacterium]
MTDLFELAAELVDTPSESYDEGALVARIEADLRSAPHLEVTRVGDNVVARTRLGRDMRLILAGHTDTVVANGNAGARVEGDVLWGVGSADMKGGLAIMLEAARRHREPAIDVTYVFYAREEVAAADSGLAELIAARPDLVEGDLALLGEPTDGAIEAGCQGSMRLQVTMVGRRAHTARAWMGRNAIHRVGELLVALDRYEARRPVIDGCEYHEAVQAVGIEGGVSGNVVPDRVSVLIGHRFAPDRTAEEAEAHVREVLAPFLEEGDTVELVELAPAAAPSLDQPLIASIIRRHGLEVRAKLGWTDVARFASMGVPAANFGPGDARLAHSPDERVDRNSIERSWAVIDGLLEEGP